MAKWILALLIAFGAYQAWQRAHQDDALAAAQATSHDRVIMYSLSTCGYCKQKGRELQAAGIRYTEIQVDREPGRQQELNAKLMAAGLPPRSYGVPIMDVHGVMLPNNPSLDSILAVLER